MYRAKIYYWDKADENGSQKLRVEVTKGANLNVLVTIHSDGNSIDFSHPLINLQSHCLATLMELFDNETTPIIAATNDGASLTIYNANSQYMRRFSCYVQIDF